jgi:hypothetical protein
MNGGESGPVPSREEAYQRNSQFARPNFFSEIKYSLTISAGYGYKSSLRRKIDSSFNYKGVGSHEKNLSAQQYFTEKDSRIPGPDVLQERPARHQETARQGTEAVGGHHRFKIKAY